MTRPTATRRAAVAAMVVGLVLALAGTAVAVTGGVDRPASGVTASVDRAASSLDGHAAGTRVAAHDHPAAAVVAASGGVSPGQGRAATTAAAKEVVGSRVAPNTARAVHASELVESPLWTATKSRTSAQNAYRHFADHGADFPDIQNSLEYVAKAQNFLRSPPGGTLTRVRTNGDVVRWHPGSNTFGVMDAGGAPRTFFRPDPSVHGYANNWDYFYAQ